MFSRVLELFFISTSSAWGLQLSPLLAHAVVRCFYFSCFNRSVVSSHIVSVCISVMINDGEHFFMCLFPIHVCALVKYLLRFLMSWGLCCSLRLELSPDLHKAFSLPLGPQLHYHLPRTPFPQPSYSLSQALVIFPLSTSPKMQCFCLVTYLYPPWGKGFYFPGIGSISTKLYKCSVKSCGINARIHSHSKSQATLKCPLKMGKLYGMWHVSVKGSLKNQ